LSSAVNDGELIVKLFQPRRWHRVVFLWLPWTFSARFLSRNEEIMGGLIPLSDASRRPTRIPVVTVFIILVNAFVFVLELVNGEAFVTQWSAIPTQITSSHHWITILTAMFMHGSWSHIIGTMIFEDAMAGGGTLFSTC
jgi:membrane associated rhomboid family serine protease